MFVISSLLVMGLLGAAALAVLRNLLVRQWSETAKYRNQIDGLANAYPLVDPNREVPMVEFSDRSNYVKAARCAGSWWSQLW